MDEKERITRRIHIDEVGRASSRGYLNWDLMINKELLHEDWGKKSLPGE